MAEMDLTDATLAEDNETITLYVCPWCFSYDLDAGGCVGDEDIEHDEVERDALTFVPKTLADELAERLTVYDRADNLPHDRATEALAKYRTAGDWQESSR